MKLKDVRWEDPDGDRYEGVLVAEFQASSSLTAEGLFVGNPLNEKATAYVVIQTAYYRANKSLPGCVDASESKYRKLNDFLSDFLRNYVRYRVRLVGERVLELPEENLNIQIFDNLDHLEIVSDFDYLSHMTDPRAIPRFLALYQYSLENIDALIEEYKNKTLEQLLIDDRVRRAVQFMGKKGEETYNLTKEVATTAEQFLTHLKKLIAFYL